ncbi:hypothetical protein GIB67_030756 [Kingdonia uniflora]|uniref:DUF4283 domain-containing protein n=1 Tax=Kingdonia uniflora TaxID=39325 RepID=A0A7J7L347_9MAGN|nr:hypothetical protein GIB67_030756 [Kingdonia uniflora]
MSEKSTKRSPMKTSEKSSPTSKADVGILSYSEAFLKNTITDERMEDHSVEKTILPFHFVKERIRSLWKIKGALTISMENGVYTSQFGDQQERRRVLEEAPWHLAGKYFLVREWDPYNTISAESIPQSQFG